MERANCVVMTHYITSKVFKKRKMGRKLVCSLALCNLTQRIQVQNLNLSLYSNQGCCKFLCCQNRWKVKICIDVQETPCPIETLLLQSGQDIGRYFLPNRLWKKRNVSCCSNFVVACCLCSDTAHAPPDILAQAAPPSSGQQLTGDLWQQTAIEEQLVL